eukprot:1144116-Pelagomonas_calceolata.AAC.1
MAWQLNLDASDFAFCLTACDSACHANEDDVQVLACWAAAASRVIREKGLSRDSGKGVGIRAESKFDTVNVPVLRRDLSRIKVGGSAWDRAHDDRTRTALVPGRGASTEGYRVTRGGWPTAREFG